MNEHLTLYVDLLGTSETIRSDNDTKTAALIELMKRVASLRGEFDLMTESVEEFTSSRIRPTVSTFSDHIVMSYPVEDLYRLDERDGLGWGLQFARNEFALLAAAALNDGFLLRGGAAVGPLYHAGGVVLGAAMLEAYEIESHRAIYPRIAVSPELAARIKYQPRIHVLLTDDDGTTHLNYFTEMVMRSNLVADSRATWLTNVSQVIEKNIQRFEEEGQDRVAEKWVWFKKQLEQARANAAPFV